MIYYCSVLITVIITSTVSSRKDQLLLSLVFIFCCLLMAQNLDNRDKSVLCTEAGNVTLTLLLFRCLIPVSHAPLKPHRGIITFKQGGRELRITPASVKYCLTLSHYSKAPHHSLLSLAFIASGSFSRSAAFHFTHTHVHLHTRIRCVQMLPPGSRLSAVCV